jgi:hypothetical protein
VTITMLDAGKRFMSMQIVDEDQYTPLVDCKPRPGGFLSRRLDRRAVAHDWPVFRLIDGGVARQ